MLTHNLQSQPRVIRRLLQQSCPGAVPHMIALHFHANLLFQFSLSRLPAARDHNKLKLKAVLTVKLPAVCKFRPAQAKGKQRNPIEKRSPARNLKRGRTKARNMIAGAKK